MSCAQYRVDWTERTHPSCPDQENKQNKTFVTPWAKNRASGITPHACPIMNCKSSISMRSKNRYLSWEIPSVVLKTHWP